MPSIRQELTNQVLHQPLLLRKLNSVWYVWLYQAFMEYFKNFIQFNSFIQWWNWSRRAGIIRNDIKWWTELSPQLLASCQLIFLVSSSGEIITWTKYWTKIKQYEQKSFPVNKIENSEKITSTLWTIDSLYKSKAREHWYIPGKIFLSQIIWKMCLFVWNLHQHVPQEPSWENCLHQSLELWSFSQNSRWLCCLLENYFHLKLC